MMIARSTGWGLGELMALDGENLLLWLEALKATQPPQA